MQIDSYGISFGWFFKCMRVKAAEERADEIYCRRASTPDITKPIILLLYFYNIYICVCLHVAYTSMENYLGKERWEKRQRMRNGGGGGQNECGRGKREIVLNHNCKWWLKSYHRPIVDYRNLHVCHSWRVKLTIRLSFIWIYNLGHDSKISRMDAYFPFINMLISISGEATVFAKNQKKKLNMSRRHTCGEFVTCFLFKQSSSNHFDVSKFCFVSNHIATCTNSMYVTHNRSSSMLNTHFETQH